MLTPKPVELDYRLLIRKLKSGNLPQCRETIRLALIGDAATQQLASLLAVLFAEQGVRLEIWEGPFDAIELQVYDVNSELYRVRSRLDCVHERHAGPADPLLQPARAREPNSWRTNSATHGGHLGRDLQERSGPPVIQSNFALPVERIFGNFDHKIPDSLYVGGFRAKRGKSPKECAAGTRFSSTMSSPSLRNVGRRNWYDNRFWNMYKSLLRARTPAIWWRRTSST